MVRWIVIVVALGSRGLGGRVGWKVRMLLLLVLRLLLLWVMWAGLRCGDVHLCLGCCNIQLGRGRLTTGRGVCV